MARAAADKTRVGTSRSSPMAWGAFVVFALIGHPLPAASQGEYHWSDQFGNKSTLLNGTVIAGVSDLGAVFYNPGRLAQILRPEFLLTAEAFELTRFEAKIDSEGKREIEQGNIRGLPSLVSGVFTLPFLPGHRFAYSFLTRRHSDSNLLLTTEQVGNFYPDIPGQQVYLGTWGAASRLDEKWVGVTWARAVSPRVSLGISTFGTYRGRVRRAERNDRVLLSTGEGSVASSFREYRFSSYGLVWKGGMAVELNGVRIGLTGTTPEITPFGSGSVRYEELSIRPGTPGDGSPADLAVLFHGKGLKAKTRSPFSFGAGASWMISRGEIHLGGEWYSGVPRYRVIGADSIPGPSSGEGHTYEVVEELKPVLNLGLGVEWEVSDAVSAYGSLIRDASAAPEELLSPFAFGPEVSNSVSTADGFYIGAGLSLESRWIDLTAGATYGEIRERMERPFGSVGNPPAPEVPEAGSVQTLRQRWRFLLGFSIPLVREVSGDLRNGDTQEGSTSPSHPLREKSRTEPGDTGEPGLPRAGDDGPSPATPGLRGSPPARSIRSPALMGQNSLNGKGRRKLR